MNGVSRIVLAVATVYVSWMAMMAVHESGHALAALVGGGRVRRVVLPCLGFSRTDVDPNPSPRLEVWGGPLWGSALPLLGWLWLRKRLSKVVRYTVGFFVGLCLVTNGAYLAVGWTMVAGDAAELIKLGAPTWLLIAVGSVMAVGGLYIWHTLGRVADLFSDSIR